MSADRFNMLLLPLKYYYYYILHYYYYYYSYCYYHHYYYQVSDRDNAVELQYGLGLSGDLAAVFQNHSPLAWK